MGLLDQVIVYETHPAQNPDPGGYHTAGYKGKPGWVSTLNQLSVGILPTQDSLPDYWDPRTHSRIIREIRWESTVGYSIGLRRLSAASKAPVHAVQ